MGEIVDWILNNVEWVFSGIGVFILGFFIYRRNGKKNKQIVKNFSSGIIAGRDVKINEK